MHRWSGDDEDEDEVSDHQRVRLRGVLAAAALLTIVAGAQLYVVPGQTARFFAWTIKLPITAAFLGGCYWAACGMFLLAWRENAWANVRVVAPGAFAFTSLTLAATVMNLGSFHLGAVDPIARSAAWAWLAVYIIAPPGWFLFLFLNDRHQGVDPPVRRSQPGAIVVLVAIQAAVMLGIGVALFLAPATFEYWPWKLNALTGRMLAAWLVSLGVTGFATAIEPDGRRAGAPMVAYALLGGLQLLALARFAGSLKFSDPSLLAYAIFLLSVLLVGIEGARLALRDPRPRAAPLVR